MNTQSLALSIGKEVHKRVCSEGGTLCIWYNGAKFRKAADSWLMPCWKISSHSEDEPTKDIRPFTPSPELKKFAEKNLPAIKLYRKHLINEWRKENNYSVPQQKANQISTASKRQKESFVSNRLSMVAKRHFINCQGNFASLSHFQQSIESCYRIVALRTLNEWNDSLGELRMVKDAPPISSLSHIMHSLKDRQIKSVEFAKALQRFRTVDGRQRRPSVTDCLNALSSEGVIHMVKAYSNDPKHPFAKRYAIDNGFLKEAIVNYLKDKQPSDPFDMREALCITWPKAILGKMLRSAQACLRDIPPTIEGVRLQLPDGWGLGCDAYGRLCFLPGLDIQHLLLNMRTFKEQRIIGERHGRYYDWFTECSSSFRPYLFIGDRHYHEIVDCPSGAFWMLAIAGYREGKISQNETCAIIRHCFRKTFYADISRTEKSNLIKKKFMRVLNDSCRDLKRLLADPLAQIIVKSLSSRYPQFWAYIQSIRQGAENPGAQIHRMTTRIEKSIIETLMETLIQGGHTHLRRVHDAIYGLEEVPEAYGLLEQLAFAACDIDGV